MAFLVILERSDSRITALIHRRSRYIRYPFHWGFPGGSIDTSEKLALINFPHLKETILRRVALRECIEETGGGFNSTSSPCSITMSGLADCNLDNVLFNDICIPPGILRMIDNESIVRGVQVLNGNTMIFFYLLDPIIDMGFINSNWKPRALHRFRGEIDETYLKDGCHFGYMRVDINRLLFHPHKPVEDSSMPLCPFLENTFSSQSEKIAELISSLEMQIFVSITVPLLSAPALPSSGTAILPGCYLRLRLEFFQEQHMNELTYRIQNTFPREFFSQLVPSAGLGSHPLHLTLCSQFRNVSPAISCERLLEEILPAVAATWTTPTTAEFNFPDEPNPNLAVIDENKYNLVSVSKAGRVMLRLKNGQGCLALGQAISSQLPGCNDWYTRCEANLHMTLGSYFCVGGAATEEIGRNRRVDFERRLDRQLRRWLSPQQLHFDRVDISEECTNYPRKEWSLAVINICDTDCYKMDVVS